MTDTVTTETRKTAIQAAIHAAQAAVERRHGTAQAIRWKGSEIILPVASVDVDLVLLNRDSHRIKAQLQSLSQAEQTVVETDPYGPQAQEIIARLLRETAGYERIKNALDNDGQLDPGVLTTGGVLVNANTRVVALRELRKQYVKVVVLPDDAGPKEITELELRLQMEQEVKQEYSFTSQLLFIEDLITSDNYTALEVGRALRPALTNSRVDQKKAIDHVEGELRLLSIIRDVQASSGGALKLLYFDDKRQSLLEIDADYQKLKTTKPEEAGRVRDAQLAGMIADIGYLKLRDVDSILLDKYIGPALEENLFLAPHLDVLLGVATPEQDTNIDGLELLDDEDTPAESGPSLSGLYTLLARATPDEDILIPVKDATPVRLPRSALVASMYGALTTAIDNKKRDMRQLDQLTAPMVHLRDAARALDSARSAYADVQHRPGFKRSDFVRAVREYQRASSEFTTAAAHELSADASKGGRG